MWNSVEEFSDYLAQINGKGDHVKLQRILNQLANPQNSMRIIKIAGTNGKGSCANYLANILATRYKVALFTSPHLVKVNERFKINGVDIDDQSLLYHANNLAYLIQKEKLTMFEVVLLIALKYFHSQKVDYVVMEAGIGARLDATRTCSAMISIITSIDYDHTNYLGNSLTAIAKEKAYISDGNLLIVDGSLKEYDTIFLQHSNQIIYSPSPKYFMLDDKIYYSYLHYQIELNTKLKYQVNNSLLAIIAALKIDSFSNKEINQALTNSFWPGRLERVTENLYLDGSHNLGGLKATMENFKDDAIILFSASQLKDYASLLDLLISKYQVYIAKLDYSRVFDYYQVAQKYQLELIEVKDFIQLANNDLDHQYIMLGSLYFIGKVKEVYFNG